MTLRDIADSLRSVEPPDDPDGLLTIFVANSAPLTSDSPAVLGPQDSEGSFDCPTDPDFTNLLEVSTAVALMQDLAASLGHAPSVDQAIDAILRYAVYDA